MLASGAIYGSALRDSSRLGFRPSAGERVTLCGIECASATSRGIGRAESLLASGSVRAAKGRGVLVVAGKTSRAVRLSVVESVAEASRQESAVLLAKTLLIMVSRH